MTLQAEHKRSGSRDYFKTTGQHTDLVRAARRVKEPIQPRKGRNPEHIDIPKRKFSRVVSLVLVVVIGFCLVYALFPLLGM